uniref:3-hydroxyisobutyryl-CoA hydrolase n=1 Tax=Piliocolobus tephrosceles TaxID=591936 RepID=A0A8C9H3E4_9PRIM
MVGGLLHILKNLDQDERCNIIIIRSVNETCFCSGSDVKDILSDKEKGIQHLKLLYMYVNNILKMKKYTLCIWNGYAMGGGLGLSMYAKYRVINKSVTYAMPENRIGFFPDISSSYFLNKYFGKNIGLHIGLTGLRLNESDLINFNVCDSYIENLDEFLNKLYDIKTKQLCDFNAHLVNILKQYPPKINNNMPKPVLNNDLIYNINKYYGTSNSLEELITNLKYDNNDFCKKLLDDIRYNCYLSCKIWYSYFNYNLGKSLSEVLNNDFKLTQYFINNINTFNTGVNEILVNKNKSFKWSEDIESNSIQLEDNIEEILNNNKLYIDLG